MTNATSNRSTAKVIAFSDYVSLSSSSKQCSSLNRYGEKPLKGAPTVTIANDLAAIPQQFLQVTRTLENIEAVLAELDFGANYPLFAGVEGPVFYVQVGVIGAENYPSKQNARYGSHYSGPLGTKIVYGRKWMIEAAAPTSEVVQTVFLAIKKAREHELREHLYLHSECGEHRATPFNTHIDLPLLTRLAASSNWGNPVAESGLSFESLTQVLKRVRFSGVEFELTALKSIDDTHSIATLTLAANNPLFPEFARARINVMFTVGNTSYFLHALMAALIQRSDEYVQEHFLFKGFARFSHTVCPAQLAQFSIDTRQVGPLSRECRAAFSSMNASVDAGRAPRLNQNLLGLKQLSHIKQFASLEGYLPS